MTTSPIFIIGSARSGTTALCEILNTATNADFHMEPQPNLNVESRPKLHGINLDYKKILQTTVGERIDQAPRIYGEKNVTLTAFIKELYELYDARFVFLVRDGREVVQSMMNWHTEMFGNFYRECKYPVKLSERAQKVIDDLPLEKDTSNYSRPRPVPGDPWYEQWPDFTLHQMLCWYWWKINTVALDSLDSIPCKNIVYFNFSEPYSLIEQIGNIFNSFRLEGFDESVVNKMLTTRINSIENRIGGLRRWPVWMDWSDKKLDQFWEICGDTMEKLLMNLPSRRYTKDYGSWWESNEVDHQFFVDIYNDRLPQHEAFMKWVKGNDVKSALDVGCGHSIGYQEFFSDIPYTGVDISLKAVDWCQNGQHKNVHTWRCADIIITNLYYKHDLVFCQGTIENVYDMDSLVRRMSARAKKYIYITAFKGYFPDLQEHEYHWNERYKCYDNKLSPIRTRKLLKELGFKKIEIFQQATSKTDIPFETVIIATR